jgi:anthranilate phosphoribosyltransferase
MQERGALMMLKEALAGVMQRQHLRREEMAASVGLMLAGEATPAQVGALAAALRLKGETEDPLLGAAETLRAAALLSPKAEQVPDTCGTGGDGAHTFNISISEEDAT